MDDPRTLAIAQQPVQHVFEQVARRLLEEPTDHVARSTEVERLRDESEDAWEHCNAFLLGYAIARYCGPASAASPEELPAHPHDRFAIEFVEAVIGGDPRQALEQWTHPPMFEPPIPQSVKQTAMVIAVLDLAVERQRPEPLGGPHTAPYPDGVWIELTADPSHVGTSAPTGSVDD